jgi:hypothetical protein
MLADSIEIVTLCPGGWGEGSRQAKGAGDRGTSVQVLLIFDFRGCLYYCPVIVLDGTRDASAVSCVPDVEAPLPVGSPLH